MVYTPGDNEWSDCHKATSVAKPGEGGGFYSSGVLNYIGTSGLTTDPSMCVDYHCGNPIDNLAKIRQLFFSQPGHTLGSGTLNVVSQATAYDRHHPTDAQYVENVMWSQRDIMFVTINAPGGSNNDADVWYGAPAATQAQADERANRTAADIRWLGAAFARAAAQHAQGVVIVTQADMWDLDGQTPAHLTNYEPVIAQIASLTTAFARPVLLFTGDSHLYRSDNPLSPTAPCTGETDPATGMSVCAHGRAEAQHHEVGARPVEVAEDPQRHQRQPATRLDDYERPKQDDRGRERGHHLGVSPVRDAVRGHRRAGQAVDQAGQAERYRDRAGHVEPAGPARRLGQGPRRQQRDGDTDRHVDEEHPAPRGVGGEQAAGQQAHVLSYRDRHRAPAEPS